MLPRIWLGLQMQFDRLKRRDFITLLGGAAPWPLAARAQPAGRVTTIGYLAALSEAADRPRRAAFVRRLGELGWVEGRGVRIEYRWMDGSVERAAEIAPQLVHLPVDIIVTSGDAYVLAIKQATATIPIVFYAAGDPVGNGLVTSLARPGRQCPTGLSLSLTESVGKRLELLHELVPPLRQLAILFNAVDPQVDLERDAVLAAAQSLGLDIVRAEVRPDADIAHAIEPLKGRAEAIYVCLDPLVVSMARRINALALAAGLPLVQSTRQSTEAGGLISYGPDLLDMSRRAAELVDKILRGAKPADIPVEQPTRFDLVINLKTANALGLAVPATVLARADEVIE
jgi:putative tryptophan/tyrosine transport system substrate-binding protein